MRRARVRRPGGAGAGGRVNGKASAAEALVKVDPHPGEQALVTSAGLDKPAWDVYQSAVKALAPRFFEGDGGVKGWTLPIMATVDLAYALERAGIPLSVHRDLGAHVLDRVEEAEAADAAVAKRLGPLKRHMEKIGKPMRLYQDEGARWLAGRPVALLGDEQGLGKTVQLLAAMPEGCPGGAIVVCPAVAKGVWRRHVAWREDLSCSVLTGRESFRWPTTGEVVVLNFDILPEWLWSKAKGEKVIPKELGAPLPGLRVIFDEIQYCKNRDTARTRRAKRLREIAQDVEGGAWGSTGTPLKNYPGDLFCVLEVLDLAKESWPTFGRFRRDFGGVSGQWGGTEWGAHPIAEHVPDVLARVMLRRNLLDVVKDLPPRSHETVTIEIPKSAGKAADRAVELLAEAGIDLENATAETLRSIRGVLFDELSTACRDLATAKLPYVLDLVESWEESCPDKPLIVWSRHRDPVDVLGSRTHSVTGKPWAAITGDTPAKRRSEIEEAFERGEYGGIAVTIGAGQTAITLVRSPRAIFVDKAWTPAENEQAAARNYRLGLKHPVVYVSVVAEHMLDVRLSEILATKEDTNNATVVAAAVQEGGAPRLRFYPAATKVHEDTAPAAAVARRQAPTAAPGAPAAPHGRRGPEGEMESWAARAMAMLCGDDTDRAAVRNEVGWNKTDGDPGHGLYEQSRSRGLTDNQWALAVRICRKYHRQVGAAPVLR